jgi:PAP2 superfamily
LKYIIATCLVLSAASLTAAPVDLQSESQRLQPIDSPQLNPDTFSRNDVTLALGTGYACLIAKLFEDSDKLASHLEKSPLEDSFDFGNWYGKGSTMGAVAVGFYSIGKAYDNERMAATGRDLTQSLLAAWSVSWALKLSINAERPNGHAYSFPSGHTATVFAAAPVFNKHYGPIAGYTAFTLATITGLARVEDHRHHLSDVLAGAAIGLIAGRTCTDASCLTMLSSPNGPALGVTTSF